MILFFHLAAMFLTVTCVTVTVGHTVIVHDNLHASTPILVTYP